MTLLVRQGIVREALLRRVEPAAEHDLSGRRQPGISFKVCGKLFAGSLPPSLISRGEAAIEASFRRTLPREFHTQTPGVSSLPMAPKPEELPGDKQVPRHPKRGRDDCGKSIHRRCEDQRNEIP